MKENPAGGIIKDTIIIFAITVIAGFLLGFVYDITKDPIAMQEEEAKNKACFEVFGNINDKEDISFTEEDSDLEILKELYQEGFTKITVDAVITAKLGNGKTAGYIYEVSTKEGYGGEIVLYVGIAPDRNVEGISILSISETPGLGMRAGEVLVPQFKDVKADSFTVTKEGKKNESEIDAITSATITSKAVTKSVNAALRYFDYTNGEGR